MTVQTDSRNRSFSVPVALCVLVSMPGVGCSTEPEVNEVRERANAECAEVVAEMRAELRGLYERAEGLAGDDAALLRVLQYTTQTEPFRNPDPCFGHPSSAPGTPDGFRLELEASLSSLRADFDNAGRRREYDGLEDARVRAAIRERLARVRVLADQVAATESD